MSTTPTDCKHVNAQHIGYKGPHGETRYRSFCGDCGIEVGASGVDGGSWVPYTPPEFGGAVQTTTWINGVRQPTPPAAPTPKCPCDGRGSWSAQCEIHADNPLGPPAAPEGGKDGPWTLFHWERDEVKPPADYSAEAQEGWRQAMAQARTILSFHERGICAPDREPSPTAGTIRRYTVGRINDFVDDCNGMDVFTEFVRYDDLAPVIRERDRLRNNIAHCDACGGSWCQDGFIAACPSCANRIIQQRLDRLRANYKCETEDRFREALLKNSALVRAEAAEAEAARLRAELQQATQEIARLRAYVQHKATCMTGEGRYAAIPCVCGLTPEGER